MKNLISSNIQDSIDLNSAERFNPASSHNFYFVFLEQANQRVKCGDYIEKHHILPLYSGGPDEKWNIISLCYSDHIVAHYIRWLIYGARGDKLAFTYMLGAPDEQTRRELAALGGSIGGVRAQANYRVQNRGWFNSDVQSDLGRRGADVNKRQSTGAWDPKNLKLANKRHRELAGLMRPIQLENLQCGIETQREKELGRFNKIEQRRRSVMFRGLKIGGIRYLADPEEPIYHGIFVNGKYFPMDPRSPQHICETTLEYYLHFAPMASKKKRGKKIQIISE